MCSLQAMLQKIKSRMMDAVEKDIRHLTAFMADCKMTGIDTGVDDSK